MDNETRNNTEIYERPGWGERISYGMGGIGTRLISVAIGSYMLVYYTNVAMLDIAAVSTIIAVSKFFDGVSDMIIGHVIDNTRSKLGKARTWLLRMCLPFALSTVLLFWVPSHWPAVVKYIYVFLMYNLVNTVCFTFMQTAHMSLISLMSDDEEEHGLLGTILSLSRNIGVVLNGIIFVRLLGVFTSEPGNQNTQRAYTGALIVAGILMVLLTLVTVFFTRERASGGRSVSDGSKAEKPKMLEVFAILLKGKYWRVILLCELLVLTAVQMTISGGAYFAMYVLNDMSAMSWLISATSAPAIPVLLLAPLLIRRFGKHRLCIAGLVASTIGLIVFALATPDKSLMLAGLIIHGAGRGIYLGMAFGIVADIISLTKYNTGQFIAGVGNAGFTAVDKIGMGLGGVFYGFVLSAAGFNAALDAQGIAQPASVISATKFMYLWVPVILYTVALVIYVLFFDMYKKKDEQDTAA